MAKIKIPKGLVGKDLFSFLVTNKSALIAEKKSSTKFSDAIHAHYYIDKAGQTVKAMPIQPNGDGSIQRMCVINTTNFMDSMGDLHLPGLWDKSIAERKVNYLCQEHMLSFDGIITDNVKVSAKTLSWMALGFDTPGETQALIYDSTIPPNRNPKMYEAYLNGWVPNHSVAMQYVRLSLAVNDSDYKDEYAAWQQYIGQVSNANDAEDQGYFWAIKEAKNIEGSACIQGVNIRTPVLNDTDTAPLKSTQHEPPKFNLEEALKTTRFLN